jgi:hypothetical protein
MWFPLGYGTIQPYTILLQLVNSDGPLTQFSLNGSPTGIFTQVTQHITQPVIAEILYSQGRIDQPFQGFLMFGRPRFNITQPMIRLRQNETQPGLNSLTYTQTLTSPVWGDDTINDFGYTHLLLLFNQQWKIIYSLVFYFNFCHNDRSLAIFCF